MTTNTTPAATSTTTNDSTSTSGGSVASEPATVAACQADYAAGADTRARFHDQIRNNR